MKYFNRIVAAAVCCLAMLCERGLAHARSDANADNHATVLTPFVNDDSFAVLYFDFASLDLPKNREAILNLEVLKILPQLPQDVQATIFGIAMAGRFADQFRDAGGQSLYLLAGLGDVHIGGGPLVITTTRPGGHPEAIEQFFRDTIKDLANHTSPVAKPIIQQMDVQRKGSAVLVGMKATVARYLDVKPAARNDLIVPLTRLSSEGALGAAIFCPGSDFRRVVRELWPELPGSLAPLRGQLADRWLHLEAAVNRPPDMKPRLALEARDGEAAELFARLWRNLPTETTEFGGNKKAQEQVKGYAQLLVSTLPAKVEGTRVVIGMPTDDDNISKLRTMFGAAYNASMESANRRERSARFHNITLGLLNFDSAKKHLPPPAICDKDGRPLLSWRVAILPYLEHNDLYKQFHLDEPWDSPHNRTLIEKMPGDYMDLGPKADQLNREGKTTCQVPTGPKTVFFNKEGAKMRDIADGTANTILVVEVAPSRAVEWTKPSDWEVDLSHPRQGVQRTDRNGFFATFCDGSGHFLLNDIDEAKLRAFLTRDGRETIDQP